MLRSRIVPSLLLHKGGLVKTRQFAEPKYVGDPLNAVKIFNEKEVDELSFFDIDASANRQLPNLALLKNIAAESRMPMCYGGGVDNADLASRIINLGFEKVSVSSAALTRPRLIREMSETIGSQSVVVTLDVKKNRFFSGYTLHALNGKVKVKTDMLDFCQQAVEYGAGEIVINCIDRDGEMKGYDLELANSIRQCVSSPLTFLGGAGKVDDMQALIDTVGVVGAAAGSLFVFKGPYRAVLINYMRPRRLN
jgi:cyclase